MGLDSIEILMKVEDTFGIKIPVREAEKIITVGDFHNAVWKYVEVQKEDKCKTQQLFYRLRTSLADQLQLDRKDLLPGSLLNEVLPLENRRKIYFGFADYNQLKLPDLVLSKSWSLFLTGVGLVAFFGSIISVTILINFFDYTKWLLLLIPVPILFIFFLSSILDYKRIFIEPASFKDFTKTVLAINYATLVKESGTNRREVESVINYIIADMAGLELAEITSEKKICDDLGID